MMASTLNHSVHATQLPSLPTMMLDPSVVGHLKYQNNEEFRVEFDNNSTIIDSEAFERIVNGNSADREEYTYFCRNIVDISGVLRYNCGCSYIADGWALTAAHCVTDPETGILLPGVFGATLGYFCNNPDNCCDPRITECPNFETISGEYFVHPDYNIETFLFDFALIKFDKLPERDFDKVLPDDGFVIDTLQPNGGVTAIGAGQVDNEGLPTGGILQELDMLYFPENECASFYGHSTFEGAAICAYVAEGLGGVCFGDSGGPLLVRQVRLTSGERGDVQIGVHSFISGTCERKLAPDVMASVAGGMPFIRAHVCENNIRDTRPYWCDGPVEAGSPPRQQPPPEENEEEDGPDGDVPPGCDEKAKSDRYIFNPITGRTKPCEQLRRKGLERTFCPNPLSNAKEVCCETCARFTRQQM